MKQKLEKRQKKQKGKRKNNPHTQATLRPVQVNNISCQTTAVDSAGWVGVGMKPIYHMLHFYKLIHADVLQECRQASCITSPGGSEKGERDYQGHTGKM